MPDQITNQGRALLEGKVPGEQETQQRVQFDAEQWNRKVEKLSQIARELRERGFENVSTSANATGFLLSFDLRDRSRLTIEMAKGSRIMHEQPPTIVQL